MNRKHRIRVCSNLLLLLESTKSERVRELYRKQYRSTASRVDRERGDAEQHENDPTG